MGILERLQIAFESEIGTLLLALFGIITSLAFIYLLLSQKKRRSDLLAYKFQSHFDREEEKLKKLGFSFTSPHKPTLFGRETVGKFEDGQVALCRTITPETATTEVKERFAAFDRAIAGQNLTAFAPYHLISGPTTLQSAVVNQEGRPLPTALELMADRLLSQAQVEETLLEIIRALSQLHALKSDLGTSLYHGFLLPQSVLVKFDGQNKVKEVLVADSALAFGIGPEKLRSLFATLRKGKLPIEKYLRQQLLEQVSMLAPEQREEGAKVTSSCDFYTFGALAVSLFTHSRFQKEKIAWEKIPSKWRRFLEKCLQNDPKERPQDFLEITDWLFDPELALTRHEGAHKEIKAEISKEESSTASDDLAALLGKMQQAKVGKQEELPSKVQSLLGRAESAFSQSKWSLGSAFLLQADKITPNHPEILVRLAISHYNQGEIKKAEHFHRRATSIDEQVGKKFHDYLACKR